MRLAIGIAMSTTIISICSIFCWPSRNMLQYQEQQRDDALLKAHMDLTIKVALANDIDIGIAIFWRFHLKFPARKPLQALRSESPAVVIQCGNPLALWEDRAHKTVIMLMMMVMIVIKRLTVYCLYCQHCQKYSTDQQFINETSSSCVSTHCPPFWHPSCPAPLSGHTSVINWTSPPKETKALVSSCAKISESQWVHYLMENND